MMAGRTTNISGPELVPCEGGLCMGSPANISLFIIIIMKSYCCVATQFSSSLVSAGL